jgi:molybdenum cofactor synthesis domain-containing protein
MTQRSHGGPTACLLVIGNEVLSGRTRDANVQHLATWLEGVGLRLAEARIIPDDPQIIVETVTRCRRRYDHVFTSGGIGPTHDDVTTAAIAEAFGVGLVLDPQAVACLEEYYGPAGLNEARRKMARVPAGATLIDNPVTRAPGFRLENVYVLPGIPKTFRAMLDSLQDVIGGGPRRHSLTLRALARESDLAASLAEIQRDQPSVDIGSYPFFQDARPGVALVLRGTDREQVARVGVEVKRLIESVQPDVAIDESSD